MIFDAAVYNPLGHNFEEQSGSSVPPNARQYTRQNGTTVPLINLSAVQSTNKGLEVRREGVGIQ